MAHNRKRRRREPEDEHDDTERWLVTYADMLTLLMVLFIVMYAMSQVDEKKYNALRSGLSEGFGATSSFMKGSDSLLENSPDQARPNLDSPAFEALSTADRAIVKAAVAGEERQRVRQRYAEAEAEVDRFEEIRARLEAALRRHGLADDVQTSIDDRGLVFSLVSRHVVFEADVADLSPRGERVVDVLAPILRDIPDSMRIDGHTNQVKVHPRYYATDWDLSAARAVTVLRRLDEVGGVPKTRLSMSAFGHVRPLVDPSRPGSQRVNKRVDIVVLSSLADASRELLDDVVRDRADRKGTVR